MRISSIDIGTNTILLLVAETEGKNIVKVLHDEQVIARLGEGVDKHRRINEAAFRRSVDFLTAYRDTSRQLQSERIIAVGTSALRDASNGKEFCTVVAQKTGIHIEILSGDEEAQWTFHGALSGDEAAPQHYTVLDIGGGSTEIISGTRRSIERKLSLDIGCVRISERMLYPLPPSESRLAAAREFIRRNFDTSLFPGINSSAAIGVAGTMTTLAAMELQLREYAPDKVHGHLLHIDTIRRAVHFLASKSVNEIRAIRQVSPGRADIILAGAMILLEFMEATDLEEIAVSDRGLRYGIVLREIRSKKAGY